MIKLLAVGDRRSHGKAGNEHQHCEGNYMEEPDVWLSATLSAPTITGVFASVILSATLVDTTILATLETVSVEGML